MAAHLKSTTHRLSVPPPPVCTPPPATPVHKINKSHTHTDREQHPRHRHTHTRQEQHPKSPPPTNTSQRSKVEWIKYESSSGVSSTKKKQQHTLLRPHLYRRSQVNTHTHATHRPTHTQHTDPQTIHTDTQAHTQDTHTHRVKG